MNTQGATTAWQRRQTRAPGIIGGLLLLLIVFSWGVQGCTLSRPTTRTILPADKAWWMSVLPDGRRIFFHPGKDSTRLMLLDTATGQETLVSENMALRGWLGDELVYGPAIDYRTEKDYYVVDLTSLLVVKLERPADAEAIPGHVLEADAIYAISTGKRTYDLLLLRYDASGDVTGGYYVDGVRDLPVLLAGIPYKTPPELPYSLSETLPDGRTRLRDRFPSPDGRYYYTCEYRGVEPGVLRIYSEQGELLNSVSATSTWDIGCYGWAWDSSGVYFHMGADPIMGPLRSGPLELLLAQP